MHYLHVEVRNLLNSNDERYVCGHDLGLLTLYEQRDGRFIKMAGTEMLNNNC